MNAASSRPKVVSANGAAGSAVRGLPVSYNLLHNILNPVARGRADGARESPRTDAAECEFEAKAADAVRSGLANLRHDWLTETSALQSRLAQINSNPVFQRILPYGDRLPATQMQPSKALWLAVAAAAVGMLLAAAVCSRESGSLEHYLIAVVAFPLSGALGYLSGILARTRQPMGFAVVCAVAGAALAATAGWVIGHGDGAVTALLFTDGFVVEVACAMLAWLSRDEAPVFENTFVMHQDNLKRQP